MIKEHNFTVRLTAPVVYRHENRTHRHSPPLNILFQASFRLANVPHSFPSLSPVSPPFRLLSSSLRLFGLPVFLMCTHQFFSYVLIFAIHQSGSYGVGQHVKLPG